MVRVVMIVVVTFLLPNSTLSLGHALRSRPWTASRQSLRRRVALRRVLITALQEQRLQFSNPSRLNVSPRGGDVRPRRDAPAVMYVPVGDADGGVRCPDAVDAAAVSVSQLVFLSLSLGVFTAITNIATNINNNNNNNNNNNDNNVNSNNLNVAANANAGNQITVQLPRAAHRSLRDLRAWAANSRTQEHAHKHTHGYAHKHAHGHAHGHAHNPQNASNLIHTPPTSSVSKGVAVWVVRAVQEWAWEQPPPLPCLGRHLCRLLPGSLQKGGAWTHGLAGYYLQAVLGGRLSLPLTLYLKEAQKGRCHALFPACPDRHAL